MKLYKLEFSKKTMTETVIGLGFLEQAKILIVGVLLYALIYTLLKSIKPFGESDGVNALVALLSAVVVSFTGVVTYAVTYAINWFVILFFIFFVVIILLSFLGIKPSDIGGMFNKNKTIVLAVFLVIFSLIMLKSFFALNNAYDLNNPQNDSYAVNAEANFGVDDMTGDEESSFWDFIPQLLVDEEMLLTVLFLIGIGVFVIILGK